MLLSDRKAIGFQFRVYAKRVQGLGLGLTGFRVPRFRVLGVKCTVLLFKAGS